MNDFGNRQDIRNEADVEQIFARRFIESLGYADSEIRPKDSLTELTVGGLRNQPTSLYRPDFAMKIGSRIRWVLEAKAPIVRILTSTSGSREAIAPSSTASSSIRTRYSSSF